MHLGGKIRNKPSSDAELRVVELLHIDTEDSRSLYSTLNPVEKRDAQKFFKHEFEVTCKILGGEIHHWAGDGGCAILPSNSKKNLGSSVKAGRAFLDNLADVNAQTALRLRKPSFRRHVRLKTHRGEVLVGTDKSLDSALRKNFDDFLKGERKFAPQRNELFVTDAVYDVLPESEKVRIELFKKSVQYGELRTKLYRLKRTPVSHSPDIFKHGDEISEITSSEWNYLRTQIDSHLVNVSARNQITKGLIHHLDSKRKRGQRLLPFNVIIDLTLDALAAYLRIVFKDHAFRISYWRSSDRAGKKYLQKVAHRYLEPSKIIARAVRADSNEYKVCQAFNTGEPVVTPSVRAERLQGRWKDFDNSQNRQSRGLMSALQVPIYVQRTATTRHVMGVLSLDADKPDVFLPQELALWLDQLVGFLANLALGEKLRECQNGI